MLELNSPPPSPIENGWELDGNGYTLPVICSLGTMPDNMLYLHATQSIQDRDDESDADIEDNDEEIGSESDDDMTMDEF